MTLGMTIETFTIVHVVLSLLGIVTGLVVLLGLIAGKGLQGWTAAFLAATVLTSVTGFGFPFEHVLPSHIVGVLSLVVLAVAILARYRFGLAERWRRTYVIGATVALYFNVFVLVVQAFLKLPTLRDLAPKQTEAPFVVAQVLVLLLFVVLGSLAAAWFRGEHVNPLGAQRVL